MSPQEDPNQSPEKPSVASGSDVLEQNAPASSSGIDETTPRGPITGLNSPVKNSYAQSAGTFQQPGASSGASSVISSTQAGAAAPLAAPTVTASSPSPPTGQTNFASTEGNLLSNTPGGAFVGHDGPPTAAASQKFGLPENKGKRGIKSFLKKKPVIAGLAVLVLSLGFLGYWFGYHNNPSVIYSQAMSNTNKGYEKLIEYADKQSKTNYKSYSGDGKMSIKSDGSTVDGSMSFKGSGGNAAINAELDLGVAKVTFDSIWLENSDKTSDVYLKVTGLKTIGENLAAASPEIANVISKIENTWIYVDPETTKMLSGTNADEPQITSPTNKELISAAKAIGEVNQEYLFTSGDKAVMKVEKKLGKENVEGHNVYKYQVKVDDAQFAEYIKAQKAAIKSSKFYDWLKENNMDEAFESGFDSEVKAAKDGYQDYRTELWVDTDTRLIYKIRTIEAKNPNSYVDVGLDYTGGTEYPFFISGSSKNSGSQTDFRMRIILNSSSDQIKFDFKASEKGTINVSAEGDFTLKPGNESYKVEKPASAKSLSQLLNELGYGELLKQFQASGQTDATGDGDTVSGGIQARAKVGSKS